jgi:hypothetical protein
MPLYVVLLAGVGLAALYVAWRFRIVPKCPVCGDLPAVFSIVEQGDCELRCEHGHYWRTDKRGKNASVLHDGWNS